jgi:hypothetical protein
MRLSRRRPSEPALQDPSAVPDGPAAPPGGPVARRPRLPSLTTRAGKTANLTAGLVVEDQLEPRIRIPTDLLRCLTALIEMALLFGLGLLARATTTGVEVDVVGASQHLARGLVAPLHSLAFIALLVLPVALAVRLVLIGQLRRLAEATAIGLIAGGVAVAGDAILKLGSLTQAYDALARSGAPSGSMTLDPYLAGLAAFLTVIGMADRRRWRIWFWLAIGFYCLTSLALEHETSTVL